MEGKPEMDRDKDSTPYMTERHWRLLETARGTVLRLAETLPHQTAPWSRPEWHDRRERRAT